MWQHKYKFSRQKNAEGKSTMQVFVNNNVRFSCKTKEKVLSSNTFGRMQIWTKKKIKMENLINDDLGKSSSDESDNEDEWQYEMESDNDNDESNE